MKRFGYLFIVFTCFSFVVQQTTSLTENATIQNISFTQLDTKFHEFFSFTEFSITDIIVNKQHLFTKQVADIGNNSVYIQPFICSEKKCLLALSPGNEPYFEILLIINKATQNANCLIVGYNFLADSETYSMNYNFVNDNTLSLQETILIGGEEDEFGDLEVEEEVGKKHLVLISQEGEIHCKED